MLTVYAVVREKGFVVDSSAFLVGVEHPSVQGVMYGEQARLDLLCAPLQYGFVVVSSVFFVKGWNVRVRGIMYREQARLVQLQYGTPKKTSPKKGRLMLTGTSYSVVIDT